MDDLVVPNDHLPDRDRREEMSFRELREFIDDALQRLSNSEPDAERPSTKEEFLALVDMLDAKLDELRKAVASPTPPTYDGPPYVSPWIESSGRLASLYDRRDRLSEHLLEAQYDPSLSRQDIARIESELRDLDREIDLREAGEQEEHDRRYAGYLEAARKADEANKRSRRLWRRQKQEKDAMRQSLAQREKIVERIRRDIERVFKSSADVATIHTSWDLAPPGAASEANLRRFYTDLQRQGRLVGFDQDRLDKLILLNPKQKYEGKRGFDGYSIFTFSYTSKAIMECFIRDNAIFVLDADPEHWPDKTKQELREDPLVTWIPYRGDWFGRVKREHGIE